MFSLLLRAMRFLRGPRTCPCCATIRARDVVMVEAAAERWRAMGVPEIEAEYRDLAARMRAGR